MRRARSAGRGGVFKLRRLAHGLYDYPNVHAKLGPLSPASDDVARALARETGSQAQIAGVHAANALGLSTQVPAKSLYLTDGPSRRIVLGKRVVDLRHASPKHLIALGSPAGAVVQALRHVGPVRAADVVERRLSASDKVFMSNAVQARPGCDPRCSRSAPRLRTHRMVKVALLPARDRAAGADRGVGNTIIEKDFCWTLKRLVGTFSSEIAARGGSWRR
ncbi:hypothetical protein SAMN02982922_0477 [Mesorhizobium australicum]|uniref:Uncharacterized protein n=1 Tax=Mesorhizobium australicum TaxID=536018 RepID=A0A1X7MPS4_9HYPH|nr:hypothetical protein SAMN02982922_0477 [Mesorhizobium australicum]